MNDKLDQDVSLQMTVGHVLFLWETITTHISSSIDALSEEEKRAIWGMEDILERKLVELGITSRPQGEWKELVDRARKHMKNVPVDFLD